MSQIRRHLLLAVLLLCTASLCAQQDPAFAHYWDLEPQFNPAAAGRSDQLSVNAAYQSHASGYDDAGGTMYAAADMAFQLGRTRHGVGALFQNDEIGLFSHKRFSVQYSYHFRLLGGVLSLGAEADMLSESFEGSKADLADGADPAMPTSDITGSRFDASAGLFYHHAGRRNSWYAGVSALHLTSPVVLMGETNQYKYKPLLNFTAGYNIQLPNPLLKIVPSAMVRYDGTDLRTDVTGRLIYQREQKKLYAGASYSHDHSVTFLVGGMFHGVDISYSYEANTQGLGVAAGFHELMVAYRLPLNLQKRGRNVHKSVRFL